jgi:two-component system cell cycle response regulator
MNEGTLKVQSFAALTEIAPPPGPDARGAVVPCTHHSAQESFKIVVADDSPIYRKLVQGVLAPKGYTILFAKDGREALDTLAKHKPSLVITDWEMPDITGLELCRRIRHDQDSYTYIVLLTSNSGKDHVIEGLAAGADDYLTKPFHSGELLARVGVGRRVVELHQQIQSKNLQLQELALTDSLTGLPNRRAVGDWAQRELSAAARHKFPFWVVVADLDHFKSVNDTYGHEAGDRVLKRFAELLRANTRASNMCGRIGGEEFVTMLTHVDRRGVQIAIERIRRQLENETFSFGGRAAAITASFGIADLEGQALPQFDELLRNADAALYSAKRKGRNRLEFSA